eukprot:8987535-Ditylum_brightwellii.AAC.1
MKETAQMKKIVSIRLLVWHMYAETKKAFYGTVHENDFFFFHDDLSRMAANETMGWMEEVDIKKHWILPEQGLNK